MWFGVRASPARISSAVRPMVKPCAAKTASVQPSRQEASSSSARRRPGWGAASASRGAAAGRSVPTAGWDIGVGHGWPIAGRAAGAKDLRPRAAGQRWGSLSVFLHFPKKPLCCQARDVAFDSASPCAYSYLQKHFCLGPLHPRLVSHSCGFRQTRSLVQLIPVALDAKTGKEVWTAKSLNRTKAPPAPPGTYCRRAAFGSSSTQL